MNRPLFTLVVVLAASSCSSAIQHGLDERAANEIISALTSRGIEAHKVQEAGKKQTWSIEVDRAQSTDAIRLLIELKLPHPETLTTKKVASESQLIETPQAERLRQLEAQEGDIEEALQTMDGVTSAAVELVVPPPAKPGAVASPSKASVLLRVTPEASERLEQQRTELRSFVAAGVEGLNADNVVIVFDRAQSLPATPVAAAPTVNRTQLTILVAAGAIALLAVGLVVIAMRKPKVDAAATEEITATVKTAPPKPVIATAVQRKPSAA